jgi:hypothetical protein
MKLTLRAAKMNERKKLKEPCTLHLIETKEMQGHLKIEVEQATANSQLGSIF